MKFNELPLYQAINEAFNFVESPRSNQWLINRQRELYMLIVSYMQDFSLGVPYTSSQVLEAWEKFGKSPKVDGVNKTALTVSVATTHGEQCFYANRGLGECDEEIELDRLIPGARGGTYSMANCVIACHFHNAARSDRNLEAYLLTGVTPASTT